MTEFITLNTESKMPVVGLGTWKAAPNAVGAAIKYAFVECGYRHIDCAAIYGNEPEVGDALNNIFAKGYIKREEVFVTSKLWNYAHAQDKVVGACKKTLLDLRLDHLDLYLMHWGIAIDDSTYSRAKVRGEALDVNGSLSTEKISVQETWMAMEELVREGLVKSIGVANFTGLMLIDLLSYAKVKPAVNQIELHPYNFQERLVEFCHANNIAVTAYSPLGRPKNAKENGEPVIVENELIKKLAEKYGKLPAQILLRWGAQRGTIVIPKSVTPQNIKNNINIFDFELSGDEMEQVNNLDRKYRFVDPWDWWRIPYFD